MITNTPFSQVNPTPTSPRNNPSPSGQVSALNNEVTAIEDTLGQGYFRESATVTYLANNSFSVAGNKTAFYTSGRFLRINVGTTPLYVTVTGSSFNSGLTTVTVQQTTLTNPVVTVDLAIQPQNNTNPTQYGAVLVQPIVKGSQQSLTADTDGATVTFDMSQSNIHTVTLGGNRTLAVANVAVGQAFIIRLIQDATGGRTVTWWNTIKWPNATIPPLVASINNMDAFGFLCTAPNQYDGYIVGQNMG